MTSPSPGTNSVPSCSSLAVIARAAGVSRMTVSRVLRNAGYIGEGTRVKVLDAVEKFGYRPNPMVSALMTQIHHGKLSQPDNVIAYVTDSSVRGGWRENETYHQFFEGASARAFQRGYRVEEFWMGEHGFSSARLSRVLYARGIRGVVVGPIVSPHGHLNLKWHQFCGVAIGYSLLRPALDRVSNDQYDSTLTALRELRRLGYRRIGIACSGRSAARVHYRWPSAFLMHQWRYGAIDKSLLYFPDDWQRKDFCAWFRKTRVDALITLESTVHPWLLEEGYRMPADVGLVHLDWSPLQPDVAGIDQRSAAVGQSAVDVAIERINSNEFGVPSHARIVALPGNWVAGATVRRVTSSHPVLPTKKGRSARLR